MFCGSKRSEIAVYVFNKAMKHGSPASRETIFTPGPDPTMYGYKKDSIENKHETDPRNSLSHLREFDARLIAGTPFRRNTIFIERVGESVKLEMRGGLP